MDFSGTVDRRAPIQYNIGRKQGRDDDMKERSPGLDLVRTLAVLCVLVTHAIAYTGVMDASPATPAWCVYLVLRFAAMAGVPLFLLLSGYLCCDKKFSRTYYGGVISVVLSYLLIAAAVVILCTVTGLQKFTLWEGVRGILNFTAHGYAWYVEMYLGLFLLIPFLNLIFHGLPSAKSRLVLIVTLAVLTLLPPTLESFRVGGASLDITGDYWRAMYPLTYYFIGAFIRKHPPKLSRIARLALAGIALAIPCVLCFAFTLRDGAYAWYMMNGFASVTAAMTGVAFFLLLYDLPLRSKPIRFGLKEISVCSFEIYLFSYITDQGIVRVLDHVGIHRASVRLLLIVIGSLVASYAASRLLRLFIVPFAGWIRRRVNL